jgi:hypothetical protein
MNDERLYRPAESEEYGSDLKLRYTSSQFDVRISPISRGRPRKKFELFQEFEIW